MADPSVSPHPPRDPARFADWFWSRLEEAPGDCRVWLGGKNEHGYGRIKRAGRQTRAHRVAYELAHGPIPEGLGVLHRCDNPPCCNPDHLYVGDQRANVQDAIERGRASPPPLLRGEDHPNSKIPDAELPVILARLAAGETQTAIARDYGVSQGAIWKVKAGIRRAAGS